jgi:hypothetical protein
MPQLQAYKALPLYEPAPRSSTSWEAHSRSASQENSRNFKERQGSLTCTQKLATPRSTILEKLTVATLIKRFPAFYGT